MTNLEKLLHRGYFDEKDEDGSDLSGSESRGDNLDAESDQKDDVEGKGVDKKDDAGEGEEKDDKAITIPKDRFDKAVGKARAEAAAAAKRADELQAKLDAQNGTADAAKIEAKLDKLEDDLEAAIADGNVEAKKRIRAEIRAANQQLAEGRAAAHATRASAVAIEQIRYDALIDRLEAEHPELNPEDDSYSEEIVTELWDIKEAFEAKGASSSEALKKAIKVYYKGSPAPAKEDKEDKGDDKGDDEAAKRREAAIKKALETKKKQPSDTKKVGLDSDGAGKKDDKIDLTKLSDAEFDKLTPEQIKAARGDSN